MPHNPQDGESDGIVDINLRQAWIEHDRREEAARHEHTSAGLQTDYGRMLGGKINAVQALEVLVDIAHHESELE